MMFGEVSDRCTQAVEEARNAADLESAQADETGGVDLFVRFVCLVAFPVRGKESTM